MPLENLEISERMAVIFLSITDIVKVVAAGKAREVAIAREVGDSVLYHALSRGKRKPREDGDAIEFHDLGDSDLAFLMK